MVTVLLVTITEFASQLLIEHRETLIAGVYKTPEEAKEGERQWREDHVKYLEKQSVKRPVIIEFQAHDVQLNEPLWKA